MAVTLALLLDALLGEPRWLWDRAPHPAVLMGRLIGWLDAWLNQGTARRAKGVFALCLLVALGLALGLALAALPGIWAEVIVGAMLLAQKSLIDHLRAVAAALALGVEEGRLAVGKIVGRDTAQMTPPEVARAAVESGAENFSDGVLAPAFWFALGGLPGLLIYKFTNTADSMIGYETPRYAQFGWAAARFDDLLNLVPARLSALVFMTLAGRLNEGGAVAADARLHRSPNAGWPEAAMARALGVALAGPRSYNGAMRDYPFVNAQGRRHADGDDIAQACQVLWRGWAVIVGLSVILWLV